MVATLVVARFESALAAKPALAFFMPGLVYLADAIGTQSEAVAVRGLSLSHASLARLIGGELRTGAADRPGARAAGVPDGLAGVRRAAPGAAVAIALGGGQRRRVGARADAAVAARAAFGTDPAYGSGPLATIVQDVLSLLIYFACVSAIVL